MLGEEKPGSDNWHADLIRRAASALPGRRPPIISSELASAADETRRFRHIAMHAYDSFRIESVAPSIRAATFIAEALPSEIAEFKRIIDPSE